MDQSMHQFFGRISEHSHDLYRVLTAENSFVACRLSGSLRKKLAAQDITLVCGDQVVLTWQNQAQGEALIVDWLARTSLLARVEAGSRGQAQPLAANADLLLICTSLNGEYNLRRIERYLAMADGAGVAAAIMLTKIDLPAVRREAILEELSSLRPPREILPCSAHTGEGIAQVRQRLAQARGTVLLGSSGVGKSSLVNALLGGERMKIAALSAYQDKGRHTTTHRQLFLLPAGGWLIDTPGMRELALDAGDVGAVFADIAALAAQCRFGDCSHTREPGCAVLAAVEAGTLCAQRLRSFGKLQAEQRCRNQRKWQAR